MDDESGDGVGRERDDDDEGTDNLEEEEEEEEEVDSAVVSACCREMPVVISLESSLRISAFRRKFSTCRLKADASHAGRVLSGADIVIPNVLATS